MRKRPVVALLSGPAAGVAGAAAAAADAGWEAADLMTLDVGGTSADIGVIRVANALMAAEASNVLARRGVDAPRFRMVAFGGAGPLVAALLAEEIGIDAILIPPFPGGLSALGAARADLEGDLVEPVYERLGALDQPGLARVTANLQARAAAWIAEQTAALTVTGTRVELAADMRYDGQGYDVTVPLDEAWLAGGDFGRIRAAFHAAHLATYGHANQTAEIWL